MKQILFTLFLLVGAAPLFAAGDEGGDGPIIPDYRELVREGYGPHTTVHNTYVYTVGISAAPKPTQAFYGKGITVYYGYQAVPVRTGGASLLYAFGYPVEYFRQLMPVSVTETNLNRYAVAVNTPNTNYYGPGNFVAQARRNRENGTTTVQSTTTTSLPAIGERPPR